VWSGRAKKNRVEKNLSIKIEAQRMNRAFRKALTHMGCALTGWMMMIMNLSAHTKTDRTMKNHLTSKSIIKVVIKRKLLISSVFSSSTF
jgi:hypothetical protein